MHDATGQNISPVYPYMIVGDDQWREAEFYSSSLLLRLLYIVYRPGVPRTLNRIHGGRGMRSLATYAPCVDVVYGPDAIVLKSALVTFRISLFRWVGMPYCSLQ